jgi:polyhydroxyalkanoate synthase
MATKKATAPFRAPAEWRAETGQEEGSWWVAFAKWLDARSGEPVAPPPLGKPSGAYKALCDAPGTYVLQT